MAPATPSKTTDSLSAPQRLHLTEEFGNLLRSGRWDSRLYTAEDISKLSAHSQTQYDQKVQSPIDLNTIQSKLKSKGYQTADQFEKDLQLLIRNTEAFYGENWAITLQARAIGEKVKEIIRQMPAQNQGFFERMARLNVTSDKKRKMWTLDAWMSDAQPARLTKLQKQDRKQSFGRTDSSFPSWKGFSSLQEVTRRRPNLENEEQAPRPCLCDHSPRASAEVPRQLVPEELEELQKLTKAMTETVERFNEECPEFVNKILELNGKVNDAIAHAGAEMVARREEIQLLRETVRGLADLQQRLVARVDRLEGKDERGAEDLSSVDERWQRLQLRQ